MAAGRGVCLTVLLVTLSLVGTEASSTHFLRSHTANFAKKQPAEQDEAAVSDDSLPKKLNDEALSNDKVDAEALDVVNAVEKDVDASSDQGETNFDGVEDSDDQDEPTEEAAQGPAKIDNTVKFKVAVSKAAKTAVKTTEKNSVRGAADISKKVVEATAKTSNAKAGETVVSEKKNKKEEDGDSDDDKDDKDDDSQDSDDEDAEDMSAGPKKSEAEESLADTKLVVDKIAANLVVSHAVVDDSLRKQQKLRLLQKIRPRRLQQTSQLPKLLPKRLKRRGLLQPRRLRPQRLLPRKLQLHPRMQPRRLQPQRPLPRKLQLQRLLPRRLPPRS